jgi:hypothetical protein
MTNATDAPNPGKRDLSDWLKPEPAPGEGLRAEMDYGPVWDARADLNRLAGIAEALAVLTSPVHIREESDCAIFHEILSEIAERLDVAEAQLAGALETMKFKESAG